MKTVCTEKGVKNLVPIIDVSTRWNSTYDMLVRAIEMKDAITETIYRFQDKDFINLLLNEYDWECIQKLVNVLHPLKEATLLASLCSDSLMVTKMIPVYDSATTLLEECLTKFNSSDDIYIGIEAAVEKLNHYYDALSPIIGIISYP
jgi:hypothetical protein